MILDNAYWDWMRFRERCLAFLLASASFSVSNSGWMGSLWDFTTNSLKNFDAKIIAELFAAVFLFLF